MGGSSKLQKHSAHIRPQMLGETRGNGRLDMGLQVKLRTSVFRTQQSSGAPEAKG